MNKEEFIRILGGKIGEKSAINYEKAISKMVKSITEDYEEVYSDIAYQKLGELMAANSKEERGEILKDIKEGKLNFDSSNWREIRDKEEIERRIVAEGVKVKKGEIECKNPKCRSKECYYTSLQTRSADEPATIFSFCTKCNSVRKM